MLDKQVKIITNPKIRDYDSSVVLIAPEVPSWIKTSSTGKTIFDKIKSDIYSVREIIAMMAELYDVSEDVISNSVQAFIVSLVENNMAVFIDEGEERAELQARTSKTNNGFNQLNSLWITIIGACNLSCLHCYLPANNHTSSRMSLEDIRKITNEAQSFGVKQLVITGGEPFLHPQLVELLEICRKTGKYQILLITNGKEIREDRLKRISKLVDYIQVSIDGVDSETHDKVRGKGSFSQVMKTLERLVEYKNCNTGINFTPLPDNLSQLPSLLELALSLDVDFLRINNPKFPGKNTGQDWFNQYNVLQSVFYQQVMDQVVTLSNNIREVALAAQEYHRPLKLVIDIAYDPANLLISVNKKTGCGAGNNILSIDANGDCFPCAALHHSAYKLGNIFSHSLSEVHRNGIGMSKLFLVDNHPKCKKCDFRYFCGGGCKARDLGNNSHIENNLDPYCPVIKDRMEQALGKIISDPTEILRQMGRNDSSRKSL